jgi:glycosyltransferase involved in cell wall biosynthesis
MIDEISIIIPAYNAEKTIKKSLELILKEASKFKSEIIVVDDKSNDKTGEIVKTFKNIKLIQLENNLGAGNARNIGADNSKYETLCFIDADIEISKENSILNLAERLYKTDETGSVCATQDLNNLNKDEWSSNFVCLKSCYGVDIINLEKEFSVCCSEFCVISKKLFIKVGKWKAFYAAGGEEFDMGYKITEQNKKNIKISSAMYSGYWCNFLSRFKRIIQRTSKYTPLLFKKKKFDSTGSFATANQFYSSFLTLIMISLFFFSFLIENLNIGLLMLILFTLQILIELKFLLFATKHYGLKMFMFSLFGIQGVNLAILLGFSLFILNLFKQLIKG